MTDIPMTAAVTANPLIAGARVAGTDVYNTAGDHLGEIYDVMLDKLTGKVAYAIMSFGGFLGLGDRYHALPWNVLTYDTEQEAYVVDLDRQTLEAAPTIGRDEDVDWSNEAWARRVHDHYKSPYYWT